MKRIAVVFCVLLAMAAFVVSCTYKSDQPELAGRDVRLTIIHTSDVHSKILPFEHAPLYTERKLGLQPDRGPYGGIARVATIVKRERAKAGRVLHLDSGDLFQGAPIFNIFRGEPEIRAMNYLGVDAAALGNHEFDAGASNIAEQFGVWSGYPILAANYRFLDTSQVYGEALQTIVQPNTVFNLNGLTVGVIGMGNLSSMSSLEDAGNSAGILPLNTIQTVQDEVNRLRESVDLVILVSHLGLGEDESVARNVCGLDVIMGGHHHIALMPSKVIPYDPEPEVMAQLDGIGRCPAERRREVVLAHSQAFAKFVGRLDLVVRDGRVRAHTFQLFSIDSTVPEDPDLLELLEPYEIEMRRRLDLDRVVAEALVPLRRFGNTGGDSMLGNLAAEAMQYRRGIETDFAVTNSLGTRADIQDGPITIEDLFNVMPFDNTITTMFLSGVEVQELFDYSTARSADRGCNSQIQISGASFTMNCRTGKAEDILIAGDPIRRDGVYELATNNYIAWGGSGFDVLKRNTTKIDRGVSVRDAVIDYMREHAKLPECYDKVSDIALCDNGIAVEDGRIKTVY